MAKVQEAREKEEENANRLARVVNKQWNHFGGAATVIAYLGAMNSRYRLHGNTTMANGELQTLRASINKSVAE